MVLGKRTFAHERRDHGKLHELRELLELLPRARREHAAARVQQRPPGSRDVGRGLLDLLGVTPIGGLEAGQVHALRPLEVDLVAVDVGRDVDEHGARPPGRCDVERLANGLGDVGGVFDQVVVLGDRQRDARDVGLLKGVGPDDRRGDLAGQYHDGHRVHVRVGQTGDRVGRPGAARHECHADTARGPRIAVRGVNAALLMAGQDRAYLRRVVERVEDGQDHSPRIAEEDVHALHLQRANQRVCAGHAFAHDSTAPLSALETSLA